LTKLNAAQLEHDKHHRTLIRMVPPKKTLVIHGSGGTLEEKMYDLRIDHIDPPAHQALQNRFRWEMILIVVAAALVAIVGAVAIMKFAASPPPAKRTQVAPKQAETAPAMTLEQARAQVTLANTQLVSGQFEDAALLLEEIPTELQESSGAAAMLITINETNDRYRVASGEALDLIDAEKWGQAVDAFERVEAIAPLDPEFADLKAQAVRMETGIKALRRVQKVKASGDLTRALALAKAGQQTYPEITHFEVLAADLRARVDERARAKKKAKEDAAEKAKALADQKAAAAEDARNPELNDSGNGSSAPNASTVPATNDLGDLGTSIDATGDGGDTV
jgi:hypothetical protein